MTPTRGTAGALTPAGAQNVVPTTEADFTTGVVDELAADLGAAVDQLASVDLDRARVMLDATRRSRKALGQGQRSSGAQEDPARSCTPHLPRCRTDRPCSRRASSSPSSTRPRPRRCWKLTRTS